MPQEPTEDPRHQVNSELYRPSATEVFEVLPLWSRSELRRLAWECLLLSDGPARRASGSVEGYPIQVDLFIAADGNARGFNIRNPKGWMPSSS